MLAALRGELSGGGATGFDPAEEKGALVVSFTTCVGERPEEGNRLECAFA